ncbi:LysM peptidoglycan-binding domain-containing protein [Clostridium sp. CM028]|uniref:glycoside hydrolase family 18 protein n=1 Tax=unclassified Clostridium TaxID=2614128 RepID=UPI001C0CC958|nr:MULTISPECIES: LysM peptidoglycan-binding domain-containing protein [unclassified Clostridium]MBU3091265.1 LysM peptidoglycan-binding domain-containing protein [Clostridium sp. CF011]MBW9147017.1 LysM peptidoglycan-binding domain-containing protein [Clostridium sp. CM027]MBW9150191.1 LysM peptidoglycan-binding domain-containing protein [Clostridium sp. CM028]UVE39664.1 LysM peptidoglycan-binding domain-containing protein [Clostridium sp. CM027]WAG68574.1 LysM peptidoglycan-binding domain-con
MIIHVVKSGETLYIISKLYGVPSNKIASDNELANPDELVVGQTLVILQVTRKHKILPGQSLYMIARMYGVTISDLYAANPNLKNSILIYPSEIIIIPPSTQKLGSLEVNGYALPTTDMDVLAKTLPSLTYLSIFSYQVLPNGTLKGINDVPLIVAARKAKVAPMMVITNLEEGGGFDSDLAHIILTDENIQNTLLDNIVSILENKNYYGLAIDLEYIFPKDKQSYNDFLRKTVIKLKALGYIVTTALAPKPNGDIKGLLYEAHDYPFHGAIASHVILMTYEWGYTAGPPMAVAPINEVKKILDYAVTVIPSKNIFMGIPNYGYVWTLPYVKGTKATVLGNVEAVDLARKVFASIQYDYTAQAPFFNYYDSNGKRHVVWFEDARSMNVKLRTANAYNLGGVSYWTIGKYFPQAFLVQNSLFDVKKVI